MAKDEVREKKEKKDKKRKADAVEEADAGATPVKKEKKEKKKRKTAEAEDESMMDVDGGQSLVKVEAEDTKDDKAVVAIPLAALVPFANPLADEKAQKKVLKAVKKGAKHKTLKRGVKECVKSIRKSPAATPASLSSSALPNGIVILAADISPMDVISHIPVLCEDHGIPYVYVPSRAELGAAGSTKRPTSVVMLMPKAGAKGTEEIEEWTEAYRDLHKLAVKLGQTVRV
ncbi:H ACA ribonucleo complex subunit 2 [Lecanosticta acicola]|uniref:H/ACA ribonucleoprotein complex subunit 2 n=1 Tax=Lecanosticta acicola TaxID=111012 RepID=A0AAI8Z4G4_9PEZI|nr:H ACA ribonucleo complex subunit 2 [Lecanosticta acicola]